MGAHKQFNQSNTQYSTKSDSAISSSNTDITTASSSNGCPPSKKKCINPAVEIHDNYIQQLQLDPDLLEEFKNNYVPKFYGIKQVDGYDYLELENVCAQFESPCMSDVKMGKVTYDPSATEKKQKSEMGKFPDLHHFGYQFLGIKRDNEPKKDRTFGRSLTKDTMYLAFKAFLPVDFKKKVLVVEKILDKLEKLLQWFQKQNGMQFYGSSLLLVYCSKTMEVDVRMIDFAHVFYEIGMIDENYLFGLRCLKIYR